MLWDTHMHTCFSGDSEADPEEMIRTAIEKGLNGICFTDHLDYDYPEEPDLFLLDFKGYQKRVSELSEKYRDVFPVRFGIEIGLQPHLTPKNNAALSAYPFDFVIGSSHVVHGKDPYFEAFYDGRSEKAAYREYFESILENLRTDAEFDVYGHIDYVIRYGPNRNLFYSYDAYADVIDEILRALISKGKGIELNTAGFLYGLSHPNPTEAVLKRYRELGGEILTVGADAHRPEHIAYAFEKVPALLKEAGFSYYTVFTRRKPEFIRL